MIVTGTLYPIQKNSDQVTLKIPFVAISFKSNLRMTGLCTRFTSVVVLKKSYKFWGSHVILYMAIGANKS